MGNICKILEHDIYKTKPNTYKILKHIEEDIEETVRIPGGINENIFLQYYAKLWNNDSYNNNEDEIVYESPDDDGDEITLEELTGTLTKTENEQEKTT